LNKRKKSFVKHTNDKKLVQETDTSISVNEQPQHVLSKALAIANSAKAARMSGNLSLASEFSKQALALAGLSDEASYVEDIESQVFNSGDCFFELETLLDIQTEALSLEHVAVRDTLERLVQRWSSWLSDFYVLLAPVFERLISMRISQLGPEHPEIADRLLNFGEYLSNRGNCVEAQNCLTRAVTIRKCTLGASASASLNYAQAVTRLGCLLMSMNNYELAEIHLKTAVELLEESRSKLKVHALEDLALTYVELGQYEAAEKYFKKVLNCTGSDAFSTIANCAIQLGSIYLYWGRLDDAFALFDFSMNFDRDDSWTLPELNEKKGISEMLDSMNNPLLEIFKSMEEFYSASDMRRFCRNLMVRKYSWAIPTEEALEAIKQVGSIVEVGAGTGYWAALLRERGANVIAYDSLPSETGRNGYTLKRNSWTEVLPGTESAVAYHPDRALMLCWPPNKEDMAYRALKTYGGRKLIYIGEEFPGCTADENFHELLKKQWNLVEQIDLPRWHLIRDSVFIYSRIMG
jgi:tetratricopeptide (TPR) repeat protein